MIAERNSLPMSKDMKLIAVAILLALAGSAYLLQSTDFFLRKEISRCQNDMTARQNCYDKLISDTLQKRGLARAFDAFAYIFEKDAKFADDCHGYTHTLGGSAYKLFHSGKKVELTEKASYCGFGFYHGVMEELFYEGGTINEARAFCSYAGTTLLGKSGDAEGACYHGIGHGVVDGTDPNTWGSWEKIIAPGLSLCERVGDNDTHKNRCASGVFNSLAIMFKDPKYRLVINKSDPYLICEKLSPDYFKRPCYEEMNTLVLDISGLNLGKSFPYISHIKDETYAMSAVESIASYGAKVRDKNAPRAEYKKVINECRTFSAEISTACIRGYGAGLVEFGTPGREYEESLDFCQSGDLTAEEKKSCLHRVLFYLAVIYPKGKAAAFCERYVFQPSREICKILK